jgi:hypothetical protein
MRSILGRTVAALAALAVVLFTVSSGAAQPGSDAGSSASRKPRGSKSVAPLLRFRLVNDTNMPIKRTKYKRCFDHDGMGGCELREAWCPAPGTEELGPHMTAEDALHEDSVSVKVTDMALWVLEGANTVEYAGRAQNYWQKEEAPETGLYYWLKYVDAKIIGIDFVPGPPAYYVAHVRYQMTAYRPQHPNEEIPPPAENEAPVEDIRLDRTGIIQPCPVDPCAPCKPCPAPCAVPAPPPPPPAPVRRK